jgi:hypothetical protein
MSRLLAFVFLSKLLAVLPLSRFLHKCLTREQVACFFKSDQAGISVLAVLIH